MSGDTEQAFQAQALAQRSLLAKRNVVGVGVGFKNAKGAAEGELAVVVLVEQKKPLAALDPEDIVPPEIDGMRTDVYEVGYLRAQQSARERHRPTIPNGVSIGHFKVTAGTLGTVVKDRNGDPLLLSNNHVFANSNDANIGDAILQPAAMDGGQNPADLVAKLERYVRLLYLDDPIPNPPPGGGGGSPGGGTGGGVIGGPGGIDGPANPGCLALFAHLGNSLAALFGSDQRLVTQAVAQTAQAAPDFQAQQAKAPTPENLCDAALARPLNPAMFSDAIKHIGIVNEAKAPALGMRVRKFGRTTEYSEGAITLLNATVNIAYNTQRGARTARFVGQVITEGMSQGGDSGSLVVDATENKAVGLLFAGSGVATIFTPIDVVLRELGISL